MVRHIIFISLLVNIVICYAKNDQAMNFNFRGPLASVFTPFNNDKERSLNLPVISRYAEFLASKNVGGVLVAGTLGEGTSMTIEERKQVAEAWADAVKETNQHLMVQVGGAPLKNVQELAAHAESIGADSLLVLPDLYVKPKSTEDLIDYLKLVSESAPNTPLFYYESAKFGIDVDIEEFLTNVGRKVPTFAGIKHVTTDVIELIKAWSSRSSYKIFIGTDKSTLSGCVIGMDSMITSTVTFAPELSFEVLNYCHSKKNFKQAVVAQNRIEDIVRNVESYGDVTVGMKAATSMVVNLPLGPPRAPLKTLSNRDLRSMAEDLAILGLKVHDIVIWILRRIFQLRYYVN